MRRADRLFRIVQRLRRRGATTATQLATLLEVSERTVYRDVRDLILSGVPIRGEAGVGYALPRDFDLPPLMFDAEEIEALVLGSRIVQSWGDPELARAAESILSKGGGGAPQSDCATGSPRPRLFAINFRGPTGGDVLRDLRSAIRTHRKVSLGYLDDQARETIGPCTPTRALLFEWASWSLGAWCELRTDFRSFRLDRMRDVKDAGETFVPEPGRQAR